MLQLFPKLKIRTYIVCGIYLALVIMMAFLRSGMNWLIHGTMALIGLLVLFVSQYLTAVNSHNQLLNRLYNQLDVDGFLREYEPLLSIPVRSPNLYLMVRLHLSNAYCAQGRFDAAIRLLSNAKVTAKKPEQALIAHFAIASNLCYCQEQMGNIDAAKASLEQLRAYKSQLEDIQAKKPERQRMVFNIELNEQCMKLLTTGKADIELLKTQVQQNNTQPLHRITTSLWIARAYLAENNRREAENLLHRIVNLAPDLYPGQAAKQLLDTLPARLNDKDEDATA